MKSSRLRAKQVGRFACRYCHGTASHILRKMCEGSRIIASHCHAMGSITGGSATERGTVGDWMLVGRGWHPIRVTVDLTLAALSFPLRSNGGGGGGDGGGGSTVVKVSVQSPSRETLCVPSV